MLKANEINWRAYVCAGYRALAGLLKVNIEDVIVRRGSTTCR